VADDGELLVEPEVVVAHRAASRYQIRGGARESAVELHVLRGHSRSAEPALEGRTAGASIDLTDRARRVDGLLDAVDDETVEPVLDNLGNGAAPERHHRYAAGERFDHHQPEWLGPVDRGEARQRAAEEVALLALAAS